MLDIDVKEISYLNRISGKLQQLQQTFSLSDIYMFKTTNGYHALCLDKHSLKETWDIIRKFELEDENHGYIGYAYRKYWVLRIGEDINYLHKITEHCGHKKNNGTQKSNAHRMFLNHRYGINIKMDLYYDRYTKLLIEEYPQRVKNQKA